jgi:selenide,water dikinase
LNWSAVPIVDEAMTLAQGDIYTGASTRNWAAYGNEVTLSNQPGIWQQHLLTDPQTSGGLLISCAPELEAEVLAILQADGFSRAAVIGRFEAGSGMAVS